MVKHFDIVPPNKLREYQRKAAEKRSINQLIRCELALIAFEKYGDITTVMEVFRIGRAQGYQMVQKGKEIKVND